MDNSWVDSYLDALLSYGLSSENTQPAAEGDEVDADRQLYNRYYVNQILGMKEDEIQRAWSRANASASGLGEKDQRLEHLSWRVWHMIRKKQIVAQQMEASKAERQEIDGLIDFEAQATDLETETEDEDPAELLTSPAGPAAAASLSHTLSMRRMLKHGSTVEEVAGAEQVSEMLSSRIDGLYVVMISMHGLVRGENMELGRDADTGGQVKYVIEVAKALAQQPSVHRVDLLTRRIADPKVDATYAEPHEVLWQPEMAADTGGGAHLVRIDCGAPGTYVHKEALWPHVREFADRSIAHIRHTLRELAEIGRPCELYAIHGHYADAAEAAALIASSLGVSMVMTGHSLGRNKLDHLLKQGSQSRQEIEKTYQISRRIEAEERGLDMSQVVFTSTAQEVTEQWGLYDGFNKELENALRYRKYGGRHIPTMQVIPPGLDFSHMNLRDVRPSQGAPADDANGGAPAPADEEEPQIWLDIARFLRNPRKPAILAMSRPDHKKNITTLVRAFGENPVLRELANLVLVMGCRDNIDSMNKGSQQVLDTVLRMIDKHDLYGSVAYPKRHRSTDVTDIYRFAYATKGVFVNIALQEPFGLTLIEAAAHGVPIVATKHGGPVDIIKTLSNGYLVEPTDADEVADCLVKLLTNPQDWDEKSKSGLHNINYYSWHNHCKRYMETIEVVKRVKASAKAHLRTYTGSFDQGKFEELSGRANDGPMLKRKPSDDDEAGPKITEVRAYDEGAAANGAPIDDSFVGLTSEHAGNDLDDVSPVAHYTSLLSVALDGPHTVAQTAQLLKLAVAFRVAARLRGRMPIVVNSNLDLESTKVLLKSQGCNLATVDYIIANGGAEMWHVHVVQGDASRVQVVGEEDYDKHITFRWDRQAVFRTVLRASVSKQDDKRQLEPLRIDPSKPAPMHPYHVMFNVQPSEGTDAPTLVNLMRKKLRHQGLRCSMTLQLRPDAPEATYCGCMSQASEGILHITPVRATRSLALRWLALHLGIDMQSVGQLLLGAHSGHRVVGQVAGDGSLHSACNDLGELVGGAQRTIVVLTEGGYGSKTHSEKMAVPWLGSDAYDGRVVLAKITDANNIKEWLKKTFRKG
ncbi:unnamed protein product [Pedinophyceae sp. YPF-701]|nr:unnamed protein product [Pedinophyceae sp. YPF-701]